MAKLGGVVCLVLVCMLVLELAPYRAKAITCSQVVVYLSPCINYARGSVPQVPPGCCAGIKSLNSAAKTTPDRQTVCSCLKSLATGVGGINSGRVAGLPGKCGVSVGYPISTSTDCSTVK